MNAAPYASGTARRHLGAIGIEAVGVGKRFGELTALADVSFAVRPGSFHALLGENGAGKSTLVKCLIGFHPPDSGTFLIDRRERAIRSPRDAQALGLGMVYQHFTLAPGMSVAENLLLARGRLPFAVNWKRERDELAAFLAGMPFRLPLDAVVAELSAGEKQKLEILKQLYLRQRLLILDEPTSVLTPGEADEVLGLLHGMTRRGELTVMIITHKFREVTTYADSVSVLRRGRYVGGGQVADFSVRDLSELMMGSAGAAVTVPAAPRRSRARAAAYLEVRELHVDNDRGLPAVRGASLSVAGGEIAAIAGVSGNGQRELVEALLGQRPIQSGSVRVGGEDYRPTRREIRRRQVFSLPEEPLRSACVAGMSVAENMALRNFDLAPAARGRRLDRAAMRRHARGLIADFGVRPNDPDRPIGTLSGGNVQRAVLARELSEPIRLLIVANPVFGLDFAATAAIHRRLLDARDRGTAVLLVSEDLDEIVELADRILVMSEGRITYETDAAEADPAEIGRYMAGHEALPTETTGFSTTPTASVRPSTIGQGENPCLS